MVATCSSIVPTVKSEEQWMNACPPQFPHSYAVQYPLPREGCCPCSRCIFPYQWTQLTESLQGMTTVQSNLEKTPLRLRSQELSCCVILTKWTTTIIIITIKIIIFVHVGIQVQKVASFGRSHQSSLILIRRLRILIIILNSVIIGMVEDTQSQKEDHGCILRLSLLTEGTSLHF